jgi:hypothetical protein
MFVGVYFVPEDQNTPSPTGTGGQVVTVRNVTLLFSGELNQWYSTGGTRRHPRGYAKYLCSFINFYMAGDNIFVI